ncbi:hypothetical protein HXX76_004267 [Chlamydomonas incerta]|uniref:Xrn1 N-terminal domain-containing protein n=1 Tax=Chlamydomonas incerta TaxID=51695 RepID=A0A835T7A9_CHLIN|nr:hypothetical protein HXX76_004267 [Chlamydomonas incerta]|eukprot:KAG2440154.1 hypothetical protein HXX76_004267 [Chlamydomonas incerta]
MGIPGFNTWFSETYPKAYVPMGNVRVDHLYIDLNSVLHTVMRRARNHNHFHKLLHKRLHAILDATSPTKSVMVAVDGPAPLAKLLTQRERRKKTGRTVDEGETLTGVAITPGTTFMMDLTHSLTYFCCTKMSSKRFRHVVFELSDGTVMGEGEVKVLGRLARHWHPEDPNDTHVILGDDADLILMALTSFKENLYVANGSLNDGRLDARTPVFSVNLLHAQWAAAFLAPQLEAGQAAPGALLHAKLDLTLIAILAKGNDYLPAARGVTLDTPGRVGLWKTYQTAVKGSGGGAGKGRTAKKGAEGDGSGAAGPTAGRYRCSLGCSGDDGGCSVTSIDPATGAPRLDAAALSRLLMMVGVGSGGAGSGDGGDEWLGSKAPADPRLYLRGCVWLLQMYLTGQCPDYRFYYDGAAPTAAALRAALDAAVAAGTRHIALDTFGPPDARAAQPLLPVACALALLPANCAHLAAPCVRQLMASPAANDDGDEQGEAAAAAAGGGGLDEEVYDSLYGECHTCREISTELSAASRSIQSLRGDEGRLLNLLRSVQRGTVPLGETATESGLQQELEVVAAKMEETKRTLHSLERQRRDHTSAAHPYRRFPIEKLEAAADAVLATAEVSEPERASTSFGRPVVLRAFNSKPDAAAFIRAAAVPPPPGQQQQRREASTWAQPRQHQQHPQQSDYAAIYSPPPPPFAVENPAYFPAIVRQQVLHDEHGCGRELQLEVLPPGPPDADVQYLTHPPETLAAARAAAAEAAAATGHGSRQQQQQQKYPREQQRQGAPPPSGRVAAAAVAAVGVAGGAGARHEDRPPGIGSEVAVAAAAVAVASIGTHKGRADAAVAVVAGAAAAAGSPAGDPAGRRGRKPKAKDGLGGGSAEPAAEAPAAHVDDGAGGTAADEEHAHRKRGRPRGSKNKVTSPAAATAAAAASGAAAGAAATAAAPHPVASFVQVSVAPSPAGPPPMPSSRLLSTALHGTGRPAPPAAGLQAPAAAHGAQVSYNPLQPQPQYQQYQQYQQPYQPYPPHQQYGGEYYGGQAAAPYYGNGSSGTQQEQQQRPGPYRPLSMAGGAVGGAYGQQQQQQHPVAPPPQAVPVPVLVRPPPYRPLSPTSSTAAAAAAAAAAGPGRGRGAPSGPRWS